MSGFLHFVMHLDDKLQDVVHQFGPWTYAILFAVIFAETGLVVTPFLPGDSLLFALGLLSHPSKNILNAPLLFVLLTSAAVLGDQLNYQLGMRFGRRLFRDDNSKIFKKSHLVKTEEFYAKFGPKTVMIARFVPVVRAMAPFVAGMGKMDYRTFCMYSILGAIVWVGGCIGAGFLLGGIPVVRDNFEIGILAIVLVSVVPMAIEIMRHKAKAKKLEQAVAPKSAATEDSH